jgi:phospholipid/cholesterol/gamma-HCH transport system ATP-binding protein
MDNAKKDAPVEVKGLRKEFGQQKVLDGIDLTVSAEQTVAILGKSGTDKSVLLKLLVGLQQPDEGTIQICGEEIEGLQQDRLNEVRKKIGFLFQQAALYDSLTIRENVEFPLLRHTKLPDKERNEKVRQLLSDVGLEEDLDKLPSQISGGMQKRVGLARALAPEPELLLLDEVTSGLDPITAAGIGKLITELKKNRKITSVVVTHDVPAARVFADRFVLLNEGKLVGDGTFAELQKSGDQIVSQFIGSAA